MPFELFPTTQPTTRGLHGQRDLGPDVRDEVKAFLYGNAREKGHGIWMAFRKFDTTQYNPAYNRATKQGTVYAPTGEAINGFLYPYTDTAIRVGQQELTVSASRFRIESRMPTGISTLVYKHFYCESTVDVTENDLLYELGYVGEEEPALNPPYVKGWDIQHVQDFRGSGGRIEFYGLICRRRQSR